MDQDRNGVQKTNYSVSHYLRDITRLPLLSLEEERELVLTWCTQRLPEARQRLIEGNLRFVVLIAKRYCHQVRTLLMSDLIQAGNIGLIDAVDGVEPRTDCRFTTYAAWHIRKAISEAIVESAGAVSYKRTVLNYQAQARQALQNTTSSGGQEDFDRAADSLGISAGELKSRFLGAQLALSVADDYNEDDTEDGRWRLQMVAWHRRTPELMVMASERFLELVSSIRDLLVIIQRVMPEHVDLFVDEYFLYEAGCKSMNLREIARRNDLLAILWNRLRREGVRCDGAQFRAMARDLGILECWLNVEAITPLLREVAEEAGDNLGAKFHYWDDGRLEDAVRRVLDRQPYRSREMFISRYGLRPHISPTSVDGVSQQFRLSHVRVQQEISSIWVDIRLAGVSVSTDWVIGRWLYGYDAVPETVRKHAIKSH